LFSLTPGAFSHGLFRRGRCRVAYIAGFKWIAIDCIAHRHTHNFRELCTTVCPKTAILRKSRLTIALARRKHFAGYDLGRMVYFPVTIQAESVLDPIKASKSEMLNLPKMSISLFRRNTLLLHVLRLRFARDAHFACLSTSSRKVRYCPLLSSSPVAVSISPKSV